MHAIMVPFNYLYQSNIHTCICLQRANLISASYVDWICVEKRIVYMSHVSALACKTLSLLHVSWYGEIFGASQRMIMLEVLHTVIFLEGSMVNKHDAC